MDNRDIRAAADRAEWQIILGVTAAFGLAGWRLLAASILAFGDSPNYPRTRSTSACELIIKTRSARQPFVPAHSCSAGRMQD